MKRILKTASSAAVLLCMLSCMVSGCAAAEPSDRPAAAGTAEQTPAPRDVSGDLLLVIDFQNVYMPGQEWACPAMPQAMENTMELLDAETAPECVMTKYVAPSDPVGRWEQYNEAYREINENPFLSEFPAELAPYAARVTVIEKATYSSMDAPEVLAAMEGKKAVVLAGVVADCCVLATMMDAIDLGYEVVYLYDCIAGSNPESEAQIRALAEIYTPVHTTIMSKDEYLTAIGAARP